MAPKILFRDSGLFHTLINVSSLSDLQINPQLGNSWECFAIEEIIRFHQADFEVGLSCKSDLTLSFINNTNHFGSGAHASGNQSISVI